MNEKVPPTASNRRKRELARERDLLTYKRKRKTIDPSTVVFPNTVDSTNEGVCEGVNIPTESAEGVNIPQGSEFETESAQAGLGAQPPLPNVCPDFDKNIPIFWGYSEGEGANSNDDVGPSNKSLLRGFRFHRARSIALGQEPQVVQDFIKLKGLDRIGAISYNYYNSAFISTFVERWQPKTNTFHLKWGEMTPTLDDVEQLVGLPADGDATVIGGTWGFPAILEVFENNLLQDLKAFKSLKAGGGGNSLSLKKLKSHYAYKLEKVLSDGTAVAAKKKKGLTTRSVARAYMLNVLGSFLFPTKKGIDVNALYLVLFAKDNVANKWSRGSVVLAHMYYNLGAASRDDARQFTCCTTLLESWIFAHFPKLGGIPKEMDSDAYEHCTCWKWDVSITDRYGGTTLLNFREALDNYKLEVLKKLKENKEKESEPNINLREALKEKTSECDLLKETIEQMKAEIELKRVVDEQCAPEFANLPRQLDAKILECTNLEEKNTSLEAEIRQKFGFEDCNQSLSVGLNKNLAVLQSHQPVPDTTLAKKYEDLLAAHEDIKKKLIAKENFISHSK
ncbi:hypothetical protein GIB67_031222 [Kingdonia uniflora]|uniref:Aminotransferase-like plant mobile domain-containing protein n=1 Tax=Kingdonia uniflora TaxID=39325 RepID=A0A7J7NK71_9MAGN|nr:hypothetical protein GIB67_031222 [Kingdonia uniflora]